MASLAPETRNCSATEKCHSERKTKENMYKNIEKQIYSDYYPVNLSELKNFSYYGFGTTELRPKLWKLFLNFHLKNKFKNSQHINEKRKVYQEYYKKASEEIKSNPKTCSLIKEDLKRTIISPVSYEKKNELQTSCYFLDSLTLGSDKKITHRETIEKILITYMSTNKSIGYVQGMNWVIAPIYFVFCTSSDEQDVKFAEEDTYFCFFNLMSEIGESFIEKFDYDQTLGIRRKIQDVFTLLKFFDEDLYKHLKDINVKDNMFCFRWITLLFSQDFPVNQVVFLWDRFLADCNRFEIVIFCCVAILISNKEFLMKNKHDSCMEFLQSNKKIDPEEMFIKADELRKKFYRENK